MTQPESGRGKRCWHTAAPRPIARALVSSLLSFAALATLVACGTDDRTPISSPGPQPTPGRTPTAVPRPTATPVPASPAPRPSPSPTATVAPRPTATRTARPAPLASPTPSPPPLPSATAEPPEISLDIPACNVPPTSSGSWAGAGGTVAIPPTATGGTAWEPAPTPTVDEYLASVRPLIQFAAEMTDRFGTLWNAATDAREQAGLLGGHGHRMAALCRGVGLVPPPAEMASLAGLIRDAIQGRHQWVTSAAARLTCCGSARTPELEAMELDTRDALDRVTGAMPPPDTGTPPETGVGSNSDLGIVFPVPVDWVIARSDFEVVLLAPARYQRTGEDALGTSPRPNGSAVRMWTVNRPRPRQYALADALRDSRPALVRYGDLVGTEEIIVDGVEGVLHTTENVEARWLTQMAVFALEGRGYFFEAACPSEVADGCVRESGQILAGLKLGLTP